MTHDTSAFPALKCVIFSDLYMSFYAKICFLY